MEGLRVRDVMTPDVTTLKRNDKLTLADDIMHLGRIRHLPVLDDDGQQIVGVVSQRDLFRGALARALGYGRRAQRKVLDTLSVKEVMTSEVITTTPDTPLVEAARILAERKMGCLRWSRTDASSASSRRETLSRWSRASNPVSARRGPATAVLAANQPAASIASAIERWTRCAASRTRHALRRHALEQLTIYPSHGAVLIAYSCWYPPVQCSGRG